VLLDYQGGAYVMAVLASNKDSDTDYYTDGRSSYFRDFTTLQLDALKVYIMASPFSLEANLFEEAEDATTDGTLVTDALASPLAGANNAVELDAQNEYCRYDMTAGTHIPEGRYLAVFRAKIDNATGNDVYCYVRNNTDSVWRHEENAYIYKSLTTSYAYYSMVFDVTEQDVTDTDTIRINVTKYNANADVITLDYFLVVPIGDGETFPQDLAHSALRGFIQDRRLMLR
jgi:hypothetical protein